MRDVSQALQLVLLLGLCTIYLYNLRVLRVVDRLPEETRAWWQSLLVIGNMAMGGFVLTAVCTRFVFSSLSLEGKAYWVLRSSPVPLTELLRAKFRIWLFPVATIGSILLASGAAAINAESHLIIASGLMSWIICYGIVGLAVGFGAYYANFDWEHPSQLAASFGSLMYMVCCAVFVVVNLMPASIILLMRTWRNLGHPISAFQWYAVIISCTGLLIYMNYPITRWSLAVGERRLCEREL